MVVLSEDVPDQVALLAGKALHLGPAGQMLAELVFRGLCHGHGRQRHGAILHGVPPEIGSSDYTAGRDAPTGTPRPARTKCGLYSRQAHGPRELVERRFPALGGVVS